MITVIKLVVIFFIVGMVFDYIIMKKFYDNNKNL